MLPQSLFLSLEKVLNCTYNPVPRKPRYILSGQKKLATATQYWFFRYAKCCHSGVIQARIKFQEKSMTSRIFSKFQYSAKVLRGQHCETLKVRLSLTCLPQNWVSRNMVHMLRRTSGRWIKRETMHSVEKKARGMELPKVNEVQMIPSHTTKAGHAVTVGFCSCCHSIFLC